MADNADLADEIHAEMIDIAVRRARATALAGISGECEECEWWMPRLVEGRCAFCRDRRPRPPDWEPPPRPDFVIVTDPPTELPAMPAKTIQIPASAETAIRLLETFAKEHGVSLGHAVAELIEVGSAAPSLPAPAAPAPAEPLPLRQRLFGALDLVAELAAEVMNAPDATAATARAEEAEARAASLEEALTAANGRAAAAADKLAALRAALAD